MQAGLASRSVGHSALAALAIGALPFLVTLAPTVSCRPGSGPQLAGHRITAAEVARYAGSNGLECADLARANLSGLNLIQVDLTRANLRDASLRKAVLRQAIMTGADLVGADLRLTKLDQAELQGANLSRADLRFATLDQATLTHANLASANLTKASLIEIQARGANFRSANLTGANLEGSTLTGAHFQDAKLRGASFTGATGAPAGAATNDTASGGPSATTTTVGPTVSIGKSRLHMYVLGGAALIFVLMALGSVRRFITFRASGNFSVGPGPGYTGRRGYGDGPAGPWGGINASGYAAQPTPFAATTPANPYGPMPTTFAGRPRGLALPVKLVLAILGALVVSIGLWLIGTTVIDAILIPAGRAGYRLCESTCGSRFGNAPASLAGGAVLMAIGGILRSLGRIRYYNYN